MDPQVVGPYVTTHVVAVAYVAVAWRWPRVARWILGVGFLFAGIFNIRMVFNSPHLYVEGFGPHAVAPYRQLIYGAFARHTAAFIVPIACGQMVVGALALLPVADPVLGYIGAITFLLAITPLGIGAAAPSTLIFAAGVALLFRQSARRGGGLSWQAGLPAVR